MRTDGKVPLLGFGSIDLFSDLDINMGPQIGEYDPSELVMQIYLSKVYCRCDTHRICVTVSQGISWSQSIVVVVEVCHCAHISITPNKVVVWG